MNKQEFLFKLHKGLLVLPQDDIEERITFYSEMIDDRMEEGLSEEEAVCEIGDAGEIAAQIIADTPLTKLVKEKTKPKKRLKTWEIVLLVLGSPIWFSLLISAIAVLLSLYVSLWAVIISLWAVFVSFIACAIGGIASGIVFISIGNALSGATMIGAGLVCAGLSILTFYGCKAATKGSLILTKKLALAIKNCFIKKEELE